MLLALACASLMSRFAYAHRNQTHRDKLDAARPSVNPQADSALTDPSTLLFFIASMSFTGLAYAYHSSNRSDAYQNSILIAGIVLGLLVALAMDTGILLGLFGLEPWFVLLSLVLSDFFHLICIPRQRCEECVNDQDFCDEKA